MATLPLSSSLKGRVKLIIKKLKAAMHFFDLGLIKENKTTSSHALCILTQYILEKYYNT